MARLRQRWGSPDATGPGQSQGRAAPKPIQSVSEHHPGACWVSHSSAARTLTPAPSVKGGLLPPSGPLWARPQLSSSCFDLSPELSVSERGHRGRPTGPSGSLPPCVNSEGAGDGRWVVKLGAPGAAVTSTTLSVKVESSRPFGAGLVPGAHPEASALPSAPDRDSEAPGTEAACRDPSDLRGPCSP